jgi:hypothetical protein
MHRTSSLEILEAATSLLWLERLLAACFQVVLRGEHVPHRVSVATYGQSARRSI